MSKFKVGDKVRLLFKRQDDPYNNLTAIVSNVSNEPIQFWEYHVELCHNGDVVPVSEHEITLYLDSWAIWKKLNQ